MSGQGARGYLPVADEQVMARQHMTALPWWQWADNGQEMASRAGLVAGQYHCSYPVPAAMTEIARFIWTAVPEEQGIEIRVHGWCPKFSLRVVTQTTLGASAATTTQADLSCGYNWDSWEKFFLPADGTRRHSLPLSWPAQRYRTVPLSPCSWVSHDHDATLPSVARVAIVSVQDTSDTPGMGFITAIESWGFRRQV